MTTVTYSLRMDEGLKRSFDTFCESVGLSSTAAINMFAKKAVTEQRIPFEVSVGPRKITSEDALRIVKKIREDAKKRGLQNMTLDEVHEEIRLAREERADKATHEL